MQDSLKINKQDDGTFEVEWDRNDPNWKFMNDLTSEEIESIVQEACLLYTSPSPRDLSTSRMPSSA